MQTHTNRQEQIITWLKISGLTIVGWSFSLLISNWLIKNLSAVLAPSGTSTPIGVIEIVIWLLGGCISGLGLGAFQAISLAELGLRSRFWPLTSVAGLGTGFVVYACLNFSNTQPEAGASFLVIGALIGSVVGWMQWLILRRWYHHTGWWIPVSIIFWSLGLAAVFAPQHGPFPAVLPLAVSTISGATLIWLSHRPIEH